jgi:Kelch motif
MNKYHELFIFITLLMLVGCGGGGQESPSNFLNNCDIALIQEATTNTETGWKKVAENMSWGSRDAGATVVHNCRIWLLGGWTYTNAGAKVLNDSWATPDGVLWEQFHPPMTHGMYPMAASFRGRILYMGGMRDSRLPTEHISNEIWTSLDGENWTMETGSAQWEPRIGSAIVEFNNALWILGGKTKNSGDSSVFRNDVWRSTDGIRWEKALEHAPWAARAFHCVVVHQGRIYLIGGGDWDSLIGMNDVWSSADAINWRQHPNAPWEPRIWHTCTNYNNRLLVIGGRTFDPINTVGDIWSTLDGDNWAISNAPITPSPRHAAYSAVYKNRLWLMGGSYVEGYLPSDVYQFYDN